MDFKIPENKTKFYILGLIISVIVTVSLIVKIYSHYVALTFYSILYHIAIYTIASLVCILIFMYLWKKVKAFTQKKLSQY